MDPDLTAIKGIEILWSYGIGVELGNINGIEDILG